MDQFYVCHGTMKKNIISILKEGYIFPDRNTGMLENSNLIFSQIIYKDIPYEKNQISHYLDSCLILSKKILKDENFKGWIGVGSFDSGRKPEITSMRNIKKFKTKINEYMVKSEKLLGIITFLHSNEIVFKKKIDIKKYCDAIVITKKNKEIEKLAKNLNIKLIITETQGINNLLNKIQS